MFSHLSTILLGIIFSTAAWASYDVTCLGDGCLEDGWHIQDLRSGATSVVTCTDHDCSDVGWTERAFRSSTETVCKPGGCFLEGWDQYSEGSTRRLMHAECKSGTETDEDGVEITTKNCFKWGWTMFPQYERPVEVTCTNDDCLTYGWLVRSVGGAWQEVTCKDRGCFQEGWTLYP